MHSLATGAGGPLLARAACTGLSILFDQWATFHWWLWLITCQRRGNMAIQCEGIDLVIAKRSFRVASRFSLIKAAAAESIGPSSSSN